MLKWTLRIAPVVAILIVSTVLIIIHVNPDFAMRKGKPWIALYRNQIVGKYRISDQGYWISLSRCVERRVVRITRGRRSPLNIYALRFRPERVDFKVLHVPAEKNSEYNIVKVAEEKNVIALINASLFDLKQNPLGLCIANGEEISPMASSDNYQGVFFVRKNKIGLLHRDKFKRYKGYNTAGLDQAVQTGPWLVQNEKPILSYQKNRDRSRRSAIAIDGKGRVLFVVTDTMFSGILLADFAKVLTEFNVKDALNLDGGNSTQLLLRTRDENYLVRGFANPPVYIAAMEKTP